MDILKLRDWYRTPTGHVVRRQIQSTIDEVLPNLKGKTVLVIGFGVPYIKLWLKEAQVFCALPAKMGGVSWPNHAPNRAVLVHEEELPFGDDFFDTILVIHSLEFCNDDNAFLSECNRILKDDGNLLAIVPNRAGAWSHREISPFARGKPYSSMQLSSLFKHNSFFIIKSLCALYVPPSDNYLLHKYSSTFERLGKRWRAPMGGVILMEAKKDMHAGIVVRTTTPKKLILRPNPI